MHVYLFYYCTTSSSTRVREDKISNDSTVINFRILFLLSTFNYYIYCIFVRDYSLDYCS
ncbi:MAG: hypothetical protein ACI90V_005181 [Bacillariaceae sp.]|jgi:hypothetical protein